MRTIGFVSGLLCVLLVATRVEAATEISLDREFLAGIVEKLPPSPFEKKGQYKGTVHSYRLLGIDAPRRRFLTACLVEGEFRPPAAGPVSEHLERADDHTRGVRKFRLEIRTGINVEAGADATARFRVDVDEIKKEQLEGMAGLLAKLLGKYFDELITQIADGRAALLSQKLHEEVKRRASVFKDYGAFCGIDYRPDQVVLHFDLTRLKREGVLGYVFSGPAPNTFPLHRWRHRQTGAHEYSLSDDTPDQSELIDEGIACHVPDPGAGARDVVPVYGWHGRKDHLYTVDIHGEGGKRRRLRPSGIAFHVHRDPVPGAVPLYRFFDPRGKTHFYTTHPHAEFAK